MDSTAPYLARGQWVHTANVDNLNVEEWTTYARQSYELIKNKLSKKLQREIDAL